RGGRRDRIGVGRLREQPEGEVLLAHRARPRPAARRDGDVATVRERRRPDSRDEMTMRMPPGVRRILRLPDTRDRLTRELDEEVRFHVEMRVARLIAQGVPYDDARVEALRRFGGVDDLGVYCHNSEHHHL